MSDFDDVMEALRGGQTFQIGGGRIFPTYAMNDGRIVVIITDDGYTEEHPCSEDELRAAIAEVPDGIRKIVDWWQAQRAAARTSWPPTPDPTTSIAEAEATLRAHAPGPPPFGDDDPWDFVFRWPEHAIATAVWPAASHLLEDGDPVVRERAVWFARRWPVERRGALERLTEVATQHAELYRAASQIETLTAGIGDLAYSFPEEQPRMAGVILTLLGDAPPCRAGVTLVVKHEPARLIERAPKWGESSVDGYAVMEAVSAMALYRRDDLLALLAALRSRSVDHRRSLLAELEPMLRMSDEHRARVLNAEGLPLPTRSCPTLDECRAALDLG
jgi:hypothetical protein